MGSGHQGASRAGGSCQARPRGRSGKEGTPQVEGGRWTPADRPPHLGGSRPGVPPLHCRASLLEAGGTRSFQGLRTPLFLSKVQLPSLTPALPEPVSPSYSRKPQALRSITHPRALPSKFLGRLLWFPRTAVPSTPPPPPRPATPSLQPSRHHPSDPSSSGWAPSQATTSPQPSIAGWILASGLGSPFIPQPSSLHTSAAFSVLGDPTFTQF